MAPRPAALLLAFVFLTGCASSRSADGETANGDVAFSDVDSAQDFAFYLGRQGYVLHPVVLTVPSALGVAGQVYEVDTNGGYLVLYEFSDEAAARRGVDAIQLDTFGGIQASLFQRGPLVVAYAGGRSGLTLTLTDSLGPAVY